MPRRSPADWLLEAIALAALLGIVAGMAGHWNELPARVPLHFNITGTPDRWGGKQGLLVVPFASVVAYATLTLASRYQRLINIPMTIDRDSPAVKSILLSTSIQMKAAVLLVFLWLVHSTLSVARGEAQGLGGWFPAVSLASILGVLAISMLRLRRAGRAG